MSGNSGDNSTTTSSKIIDVSETDTHHTNVSNSDNEIYYSGDEEPKQHYKLSLDLEIASPNKPQRSNARTILRVKPSIQPVVVDVDESTTSERSSRRKPVGRPVVRVADGTLQEISSKRVTVQPTYFAPSTTRTESYEDEYRAQEFHTMQEEILSLILSNSQLKKENAQLIEAYRHVHRAKRRLEDEITDIRATLSQNEDDMTKLYNYIAFLEARVNKLNSKQTQATPLLNNIASLPKKRGRPAARGGKTGRPAKKTRVGEQPEMDETRDSEEESGPEQSDSGSNLAESEPEDGPGSGPGPGPEEGEEEEESTVESEVTSPTPTKPSQSTPDSMGPVKRKVGRPRRAPESTPPLVPSQRTRGVFSKNKDGSDSFLDTETDELDRRRTRFSAKDKDFKEKDKKGKETDGEKEDKKEKQAKDKKGKTKVPDEDDEMERIDKSEDIIEILDVDLSWAAMIAHSLKTLGGVATHREIAERLRAIFPRVHGYKNLSNTISSVLSISGKFLKETIEPQEGSRVTYNWSLKPGEVILPIPKPKPSADKAMKTTK